MMNASAPLIARIRAEVNERFGAFLRDEVSPGAAARDRAGETFSPALTRRAAELGLFGFALPKEAGGGGANDLEWGLALEEIGYLCEDLSFPQVLFATTVSANAIWHTGRADYAERYVRPMARGERRAAFCFSEGSDAFSFKTRARRQPDGGYLVDGEKLPIGAAVGADTFIVYARDERDDVIAVLVERDDPGVHPSPVEVNGLRATDFCRLRLEGVAVPADRVMIPADGVSHSQLVLNGSRLLIVCGLVGRMRAVLELVMTSLRRKVRFDHPVIQRQNVQASLGRMVLAIESARAMIYRALEAMVQGHADRHWDPLVSAAKCNAAEQAHLLMTLALRLLGGEGFMDERMGRYQRDFAGFFTANGTSDLLEIDLGLHALQQLELRSRRKR